MVDWRPRRLLNWRRGPPCWALEYSWQQPKCPWAQFGGDKRAPTCPARAAAAASLAGIHSLQGLVVIDVVEGTALASLPYMATVLAGRPAEFASLRQAVRWACSSGECSDGEGPHTLGETKVTRPHQLLPGIP